MSSKFNFQNYYRFLEEKKEEDNMKEVKENKEMNKKGNKSEMSLHDEMNLMEKRIYGFAKPYFKKIDFIDKNMQKLALDKEISGAIKYLKKKGYEFENEDEVLEQLEVNYLMGLGFKFNKNKAGLSR